MHPKQIAGSCNPITRITSSIMSAIYNNSTHRKAGGNNEGGNTNKRRIRTPNITNCSSNITNLEYVKNRLKKKLFNFFVPFSLKIYYMFNKQNTHTCNQNK